MIASLNTAVSLPQSSSELDFGLFEVFWIRAHMGTGPSGRDRHGRKVCLTVFITVTITITIATIINNA